MLQLLRGKPGKFANDIRTNQTKYRSQYIQTTLKTTLNPYFISRIILIENKHLMRLFFYHTTVLTIAHTS